MMDLFFLSTGSRQLRSHRVGTHCRIPQRPLCV